MPTPQISVIMSVFNGIPYIKMAIESILNQTYTDFEFIIVDDGSNDGTSPILRDYAKKDSRIILIENQSNIGYSRSLNISIANARGKFLARQDADDISMPTRLEKQINYLLLHPEIGLLGVWPIFIDEYGNIIQQSNYIFISNPDDIHNRLLDNNCMHHGSIMLRREIIDRVGVYNVDLEPSEDYDLWLRISEISKIANIDERLYKYRIHRYSVSNKKRFLQMQNKAIALENAIYRRYGPNPLRQDLYNVSRDYLRAYVLASFSNHHKEAEVCLDKALFLNPEAIRIDGELSIILNRYSPKSTGPENIEFVELVFKELIRRNKQLRKLKNRFLAEAYLKQADQSNELDRQKAYLREAVRCSPGLLLNRGVMKRIIKNIFT